MVDKNVVLVTGSQRSGTTLLHLILDSHPAILGIDEDAFDAERFDDYLQDPGLPDTVSFKLPHFVSQIGRIRQWPNLKVLFCIRDPRDVVTSMIRLHVPMGEVPFPWISHPRYGAAQIYDCASVLARLTGRDISQFLLEYPQIAVKPGPQRTRMENVYCASLCWRLVNQLIPHYVRSDITLGLVVYEQLVERPEEILKELMVFLGHEFHPDLLRHEKLHSGISVGATDNARGIDQRSLATWKQILTSEEIAVVRQLCGEMARQHGYEL